MKYLALLLVFSSIFSLNLRQTLSAESQNELKISEIFNIKTHKVYDIHGDLADLSLYDRISSIISFLGPNKEHIIIGGLGARDKSNAYPYDDFYFEKNYIIRSTNGGKTWTALTPRGKTDRKVYGLSTNNKGVVIAVTGDRQHSCILSSTNYGLTWKVALTNADLKNTKQALYNSYYSKSRNLFLIPVGDTTYTTSDGINFKKGEYNIPLARNGYVFEELDEIWFASQWGSSNLNVLKKGQKKYQTVLTAKGKQYFSTVKYLGKGIFVAMSYGYPGSKSKDYTATAFERKNNYLYLTIPNHNLKKGMVTMNVKPDSPMYSTMQNGLDYKVIDNNIIKMYQEGNDVNIKSTKLLVRIYEDQNMVKPFLYRSTDYGKTWSSKQIRGATFSHGMVWTRDILNLGNGLLYINFAGDENTAEYECAMFLKSTDYGETWKITNDILGKNNSKLNAIYRSVNDVDGSVIAGAQNYARILKFE